MRRLYRSTIVLLVLAGVCALQAQPPQRIAYNHQQLFLSGANMAWMNFANDLGPAPFDTATFGSTLLQMHDYGGNAIRWWLHTDGTVTPQFDDSGRVTGPGIGAIAGLQKALDLAWQREVGVILCLWSHDMLHTTNTTTVLNRNLRLLTDTAYTQAYIQASLIPMVEAVKGHPAIIAWEIFNEPEGFSNEFGWSDRLHIPMSDIQRFINLCAGAIHRTDSTALVTSGAWSFKSLTNTPVAKINQSVLGKAAPLTPAETEALALRVKEQCRLSLSTSEIIAHLQHVASLENYDYYSAVRLIAAGGDPDGVLDFFSVHYYTGIDPSNPTSISPFHHPAVTWGAAKPLVVGEFAMQNTVGVPKAALFDTLYHLGYAGALPWSWTDPAFSSRTDMLAGMQYMWYHYRADVDVNGIGGFWPNVSILSPPNDTTFADTASVTIVTAASDSDGTVIAVRFYADTAFIGVKTEAPFTFVWPHAPNGQYALTAVATDNQGHQRTSALVRITVGKPLMTKLEAEAATRSGSGMTPKSDPTASGGAYLDMASQTGTVTWKFRNVQGAGSYPVTFGFKLFYDHPKSQYINVNGVRADTVEFNGTSSSTWLTKTLTVDLIPGDNTIQMELYWGWMYLDYLAVPTNVLTSVSGPVAGIPGGFVLEQNYPNPFNPTTGVRFQVSGVSDVKITVYDVLGREVAVLVNERKTPGTYTVRFDGTGFSSGVYFYQMRAGNFVETKKLVLLK